MIKSGSLIGTFVTENPGVELGIPVITGVCEIEWARVGGVGLFDGIINDKLVSVLCGLYGTVTGLLKDDSGLIEIPSG